MYKLLIFDADHTLFDFEKSEKIAIESVLDEIGLICSDKRLHKYREINFSLWKKYERNEVSQNEIKTERFRLFFKYLGIVDDFYHYSQKHLEYLSQGYYLLDGALELIKTLSVEYKLALLTNGLSEVQHPRYRESALYGFFDAFVVSGDVGISKPNAGIFKILAEKTKFFQKDEMLMIGDSLTSDILGGINYGIDTCWFNPSFNINHSDIKPSYEINNMKELYKILKE